MNASTILAELAEAGVTLFLDQGRLRYRATPAGAYTRERRELVAEHRNAIATEIRRRAWAVTAPQSAPPPARARAEDRSHPSGDSARPDLETSAPLPAPTLSPPSLVPAVPEKRPPSSLRPEPSPNWMRMPPLDEEATPPEAFAPLRYAWARGLPIGVGHLLWDAARLWERDQGTPQAERWAKQFRDVWVRAAALGGTREPHEFGGLAVPEEPARLRPLPARAIAHPSTPTTRARGPRRKA